MQKNQFGFWMVVTLVALRVTIGMHFFREGMNKLRDPKPFSSYFFAAAKGPFAGLFHGLVWDRDGSARLSKPATLEAWDRFRVQVESHYRFDDSQKKRAGDLLRRYEQQLTDYLDEKSDDIRELEGNVARRNSYQLERQRLETPSLLGQIDRIESDIRGKRSAVLPGIDAIWKGLAQDLNGLATAEQRTMGQVTLDRPGKQLIDSESIDAFIPWFDAVLGVLLVAGLFTRPAAIAGAIFLLSVVASQWPTAAGAVPSWPQGIEALGLLVVAAAGAGRFAGFDALISAFWYRRSSSTK